MPKTNVYFVIDKFNININKKILFEVGIEIYYFLFDFSRHRLDGHVLKIRFI